MNVELFEKIAAVGSTNEKKRLLSQCTEDDKQMLRWALDPDVTFGVTVDDKQYDGIRPCLTSPEYWWDELALRLKMLSTRQLSGNAATEAVGEWLIAAPSIKCRTWACRVINRDLRCGVNLGLVRKVFPGFIVPFAVSLAQPYDPDKHELTSGWLIEPKLDGLRMIVHRGRAYSRNGKEIETVGHILEELGSVAQLCTLDGEVMGLTDFDSDSGKTRKKGIGAVKSLFYNVFDYMPAADWDDRQCALTATERFKELCLLNLERPHVRTVSMWHCKNPTGEKLRLMRDEMISQGYEGIMLKRDDALYSWKRTDDVLKMKKFLDADGRVTSLIEGRGKHEGRLGALMVDFGRAQTKVGSGFSDEQRDQIWRAPARDYVGKTVEVQYQNETPDGRLRFPVFVRFRPDKD